MKKRKINRDSMTLYREVQRLRSAKETNVKCPKCGKQMDNLGNLSGIVLMSHPAQWTDTYICEDCKIKKDVHVSGKVDIPPDLSEYTEA